MMNRVVQTFLEYQCPMVLHYQLDHQDHRNQNLELRLLLFLLMPLLIRDFVLKNQQLYLQHHFLVKLWPMVE